MGGSDQWGNITSGTELIRRKGGNEAFALTTQLLKKADGSKFGKSEGGNIWLDKTKTSPYKFYQYWINTTDEDVEKFIKLFTFLTEEEIATLTTEHNKDKGKRILQKELAKQVTCLVHSIADYNSAIETSEILFKGNMNDLAKLNEETFLDLFDGVPQFNLNYELINEGINIAELLADKIQRSRFFNTTIFLLGKIVVPTN
jgi:tyrosyl-tRNA synthetase